MEVCPLLIGQPGHVAQLWDQQDGAASPAADVPVLGTGEKEGLFHVLDGQLVVVAVVLEEDNVASLRLEGAWEGRGGRKMKKKARIIELN